MKHRGRFASQLQVIPLEDGVNWKLTRPLKFWDWLGAVRTVPAGFVTDFASIPSLSRIGLVLLSAGYLLSFLSTWFKLLELFALWVLWIAPLLNNDERLDAPSTLHDYQYRTVRHNRREADNLFWEAMTANRLPLWIKSLVWGNVRLFGWIVWKRRGKVSKR